MKKKKKESFKFSGRSHSIKGMISFALGLSIILTLLVLMFTSSLSSGNGGIQYGIIGLILAILSIYGFALGIKSCKEKEIYYTAPISGVVINGGLIIIFITLYLIGFLI